MTPARHRNWGESSTDDKFTTWRCRGCKAYAVTVNSQNAHPGTCLRCEAKARAK